MRAPTGLQIAGYLLPALLSLSSLTGCGGSGEGLDQNGRPPTPQSAGTVLTANFTSIQTNVFTPVCTACHAGATAPRGLRLDADNSYALLVGVASVEVPGLQRVRPGDPNSSYLIQKLTGAAAVGQRMPLGGPYLPQATIDVIKQWIADGAQRPFTVNSPEKSLLSTSRDTPSLGLQVATTSPLDNSLLDAPPTQIVIGFDRELDSTLVNDSTVRLEKIFATDEDLANPSPDPSQAIAVRLDVSPANTWTLLITPKNALTAGNYRLTLRGSGGGALAGFNTLPLNANAADKIGNDVVISFGVKE